MKILLPLTVPCPHPGERDGKAQVGNKAGWPTPPEQSHGLMQLLAAVRMQPRMGSKSQVNVQCQCSF